MELVNIQNPFERTQKLIQEYAEQLYGIKNASAVTVLCELAFDEKKPDNIRLSAAKELVSYEIPKVKAIELIQPKSGPDYIIEVLGSMVLDSAQEDEIDQQLNYCDAEVVDIKSSDGYEKIAQADATIDEDMRADW
jgi:hypothetical protein